MLGLKFLIRKIDRRKQGCALQFTCVCVRSACTDPAQGTSGAANLCACGGGVGAVTPNLSPTVANTHTHTHVMMLITRRRMAAVRPQPQPKSSRARERMLEQCSTLVVTYRVGTALEFLNKFRRNHTGCGVCGQPARGLLSLPLQIGVADES